MNLRKQIINFIIDQYPVSWDSDKFKVLIYEQDIKRREIFKKLISDSEIKLSEYDFKIVNKKIEYLVLSKYANIIFTYSISSFLKTDNLKFIYIGQVGYKSDYSLSSNIKIISTPNYASKYITEYILAAILIFEKQFFLAINNQREKIWKQTLFFKRRNNSISELKVGILGVGRIGSMLADYLKKFNIYNYGYDRKINTSANIDKWITGANELPVLFRNCDYIVITIAYNRETHHLINKNVLDYANNNLCIINVSRGEIIEEKSLIYAINNKQIRGAVLDVFSKEPLPKKHPFWKMQNVIITPHISGNVNLVFDKIVKHFLHQLKNIF